MPMTKAPLTIAAAGIPIASAALGSVLLISHDMARRAAVSRAPAWPAWTEAATHAGASADH